MRGRYWTQLIVRGVPFGLRGKNKLVSIEEVVSGTYQIGTQLDGLGHIAVDNLFYEFMFVLTKSKTKGSTGANISPAAVR